MTNLIAALYEFNRYLTACSSIQRQLDEAKRAAVEIFDLHG